MSQQGAGRAAAGAVSQQGGAAADRSSRWGWIGYLITGEGVRYHDAAVLPKERELVGERLLLDIRKQTVPCEPCCAVEVRLVLPGGRSGLKARVVSGEVEGSRRRAQGGEGGREAPLGRGHGRLFVEGAQGGAAFKPI